MNENENELRASHFENARVFAFIMCRIAHLTRSDGDLSQANLIRQYIRFHVLRSKEFRHIQTYYCRTGERTNHSAMRWWDRKTPIWHFKPAIDRLAGRGTNAFQVFSTALERWLHSLALNGWVHSQVGNKVPGISVSFNKSRASERLNLKPPQLSLQIGDPRHIREEFDSM